MEEIQKVSNNLTKINENPEITGVTSINPKVFLIFKTYRRPKVYL